MKVRKNQSPCAIGIKEEDIGYLRRSGKDSKERIHRIQDSRIQGREGEGRIPSPAGTRSPGVPRMPPPTGFCLPKLLLTAARSPATSLSLAGKKRPGGRSSRAVDGRNRSLKAPPKGTLPPLSKVRSSVLSIPNGPVPGPPTAPPAVPPAVPGPPKRSLTLPEPNLSVAPPPTGPTPLPTPPTPPPRPGKKRSLGPPLRSSLGKRCEGPRWLVLVEGMEGPLPPSSSSLRPSSSPSKGVGGSVSLVPPRASVTATSAEPAVSCLSATRFSICG